jgi:hypothetical protein
MATATSLSTTTYRQRETVELDPLAGEDELWAEEDFLYGPDEDEYVGFLRMLWLSVLACALFWVVVALSVTELVG